MKISRLYSAVVLLVIGTLPGFSAPLERVDNTTLQLPDRLPEGTFTTENALPGLSFTRPVAIVSPPDTAGPQRLFVLEQTGRVIVIPDLENPVKEVFLDLAAKTAFQGESGLLGMAFHPEYAGNGLFYIYYSTRLNGQRHQRVARFQVSGDNPNRAEISSEVPMIDQLDQASNHNGGDLHFGPDGYLYVSLGDEGGANDTYDNARFIDRDFHAAILRIDVDRRPDSLAPNSHTGVHEGTYAIPPDNPFIGQTRFLGRDIDTSRLRTEFWAVGLRNPWRFSFDPVTGELWCGDVGQNAREEIDVIERGGNYGWSFREGTRAFTSGPGGARVPSEFDAVAPLWDYGRGEGRSVTGGIVYRGDQFTELYGAYIFADYETGNVWSLKRNDSGAEVEKIASAPQIAAFSADPRNGDVLMAAYGSGQIRRLIYQSDPSSIFNPVKLPRTLSQTGAFSNLGDLVPEPGVVSYEPKVSFWSDHAIKQRWFALPDGAGGIGFSREEPWSFPTGTVWVKHFELEMVRGDPSTRRRLETRFLVKTGEGSYGVTYRWNDEQTDATLVPEEGMDETFAVREGDTERSQTWRYPSRGQCLSCHTRAAGHVLAFDTRQLNAPFDYGSETTNQLTALSDAGYFETALALAPESLPSHARLDDESRSLEHRVRSYLAVNCAQCHQPTGTALGLWDARAHLPTDEAGIINGPVAHPGPGDSTSRVVAPGSLEHSGLYQRLKAEGAGRMPPVASHEIDEEAVDLLRRWIEQLPGRQTFGQWQEEEFPDPSGAAAAPEADPDNDGQSNYSEFLTLTGPLDSGSLWTADLVMNEDASPVLRIPLIPDRAVVIETSLDALQWEWWDHPDNRLEFPSEEFTREISLDPSGEPLRLFRFRVVGQ